MSKKTKEPQRYSKKTTQEIAQKAGVSEDQVKEVLRSEHDRTVKVEIVRPRVGKRVFFWVCVLLALPLVCFVIIIILLAIAAGP